MANPLTAAAGQNPYSAAAAQYNLNPALLSYTRLPGLSVSSESVYGSAAAAAALAPTQGIYSLGTDPAAFYVNPITVSATIEDVFSVSS